MVTKFGCPECGCSNTDDEVDQMIKEAHKEGEKCERACWEAKLEKLRKMKLATPPGIARFVLDDILMLMKED